MRWFAGAVASLAAVGVLTGCVGWIDDPPGDPEWNVGRGNEPPHKDQKPYTDLVHLGVDVGKQSTRFVARVLTTAPPPIDVAITWSTHGGGAADYYVLLQRFDGETRWQAGLPRWNRCAPVMACSTAASTRRRCLRAALGTRRH